ncbi:hypothetical protein DFH11DRAFT_1640127 [Phellopilus nigrolimitatus]|nr:hypothetical protein DFH11DRAFT_1640127 [Phellopilus nigrolimitatus]
MRLRTQASRSQGSLVADCTDIALAAEFLFERRQHEGYIRALYELINNAGDRVARPESLERMLALAEGLENAKNEEGCHGVEEHADVRLMIKHRQHPPFLRKRACVQIARNICGREQRPAWPRHLVRAVCLTYRAIWPLCIPANENERTIALWCYLLETLHRRC